MLKLKIDLEDLQIRLQAANTLREKISILESEKGIEPCRSPLSEKQLLMYYSVIAIGQEHILKTDHLKEILDKLYEVEEFYAPIGGVIGYQETVFALLQDTPCTKQSFSAPRGIDLTAPTKRVREALLHAVEHWSDFAEVYPVGGAADRLQLKSAKNSLPAARLEFAGQSLLAGMLRDVEAREYLHYKLFGKQITTPIVMMTSQEKGNAAHIEAICNENGWFHRPKSSIQIACQPLVPTVDEQGMWLLKDTGELLLKPGGHGAIWQLMLKEKIFDWLQQKGIKSLFLRQINNPIASIDGSALSFLGLGHMKRKAFGFASCIRLVGSAEGVNVVKRDSKGRYALTNIEYCTFKRHGIKDEKGPYSRFPSNTNILYADLTKAKETAGRYPLPGMLLNFRAHGDAKFARIEAMMQNIADAYTAPTKQALPTYMTFNHRHKTISTTKRKFSKNQSWLETPEGCFFDLLKNAHELLEKCNFDLPTLDEDAFFNDGPPFIFLYHPALGPLYSIIAQKLKGGRLTPNSELILEIADIAIENLDLSGSLIIETSAVTGHIDARELRRYSHQTGRCILKNVTIENDGIKKSDEPFWRHVPERTATRITLDPTSLFIAENITFTGSHTIHVPPNVCMHAKSVNGEIVYTSKPYHPAEPFYNYTTSDARIHVTSA